MYTQVVSAAASKTETKPKAAPEITGDAVPSALGLALSDVVEGARASHLWGLLGWQDIRQRYRRSKIGPFWLTISMGVMVGSLGVLYAELFKMEVADYLPFIALGFMVWGLLSGLITEGCAAFIAAEGIIKQVGLPLSVHVYRVVWRNLIIFGHNAVIFLVVAVLFLIWPGWIGLLALPGLAFLCLNGIWIGLLLGLVSARFRDVPQIVASVMQVAFFLTPIIWKPTLLPSRAMVLDLNPFFHFVELVRAPLLGQAPGLASWLAVLGMTLGGWLATLALYRRYRWRIAYWM
jgi:ABC-type polysaccharide/polyol phosphate export permease